MLLLANFRIDENLTDTDDQIVFWRLFTDSIDGALGELRALISRFGGLPKNRLYSRLNWRALSYPTSNAAREASTPSVSIRDRQTCRKLTTL
jgi:hypothetical protein